MLRKGVSTLAGWCKSARPFSAFTDIPIVDIAPLVDKDAPGEEQQAAGKKLHDACVAVGFFYVTNHGAQQ